MTHEPTILGIFNEFGGSFYSWKGEDKTAWCWSLSGKAAGGFCRIILPYSITKREEIEKALLFLEVLPKLSILEKEQFYRELQELKKYEFVGYDEYARQLNLGINFEEALED